MKETEEPLNTSNPESSTAEPLDDSNATGSNSTGSNSTDNQYLKLRQLLLGDDYSSALDRYISKEEDVERVSSVLPEAVQLSAQEDSSLGTALAPVVDKAIENSIVENPSRITNIIFPIMGPAIRKAVASALSEMVQSLNTLLEQSLTFKSLNWRIRAWRSGMPYAQYVLLQTIQYRVEQVLLVHRETGLLLHSVTAPEVQTQDPELVSSMLTAITDFVNDSFSSGEDTLERIRFGHLELHLMVGPDAILAVAVRGTISDELTQKANATIETVHARFRSELSSFEGDRAPFERVQPILSECLLSQKVTQKPRRKPWLAIILLLIGFSFLVKYQVERYQYGLLCDEIEQVIRQEPGYVVIAANRGEKNLVLDVLRSPSSRPVDSLRPELGLGSDFLTIKDTVVHFGPLPAALSNPTVAPEESELEKMQALINRLQQTIFYFESEAVELSEIELQKISGFVDDLKRLQALYAKLALSELQIMIMGFADKSGTSTGNKSVSQQRAETVRAILTENGVSSDIIVAWGVGHIDQSYISKKTQRRVTVQVLPKLIVDDRAGFDQGGLLWEK